MKIKKSGFTLIEIIICIGMLAVIAVGSIVGIHLVNKNLVKKGLEQITDKAIQAAQVYIETNKETSNRLYNNKNGVSLPLQLLVNEGLLSLKGTNLDENKIKNQYVVTFLSGGGEDNCEQVKTITSWSNDQPVYLCINGTTGSSNLATIDPIKYNNKTNVTNEPYYFKGPYPNNYVDISKSKFANSELLITKITFNFSDGKIEPIFLNPIRILYIDRDDSIVLQGVLNRIWLDSVTCDTILNTNFKGSSYEITNMTFYNNFREKWSNNSRCVKQKDFYNTAIYSESKPGDISWIYDESVNKYMEYGIIISLPTSVKIKSGTGTEENPFILEEK